MAVTQSAWSRYWQTGAGESCFAEGGAPEITQFWQSYLQGLSAGTRVLDAACGGGALTRQLVEYATDFEVTGVDYASELPEVSGASIQAGVRLESLPFASSAFGAVVSQFGLEYADHERALGEVLRVLGDDGALGLVMHKAGSPLLQAAQRERDSISPLLDDGGLLATARSLAAATDRNTAIARSRATDTAFKTATQGDVTATLDWALTFFAEIMENWPRRGQRYLAGNCALLVDELSAFKARIDAMHQAALSAEAVHRLVARVEASKPHLSVRLAPLGAEDQPLAWAVTAVQRG
ncbi:MAG: class I SAM-dependent methyltransferase [Luminiphilus sp.]